MPTFLYQVTMPSGALSTSMRPSPSQSTKVTRSVRGLPETVRSGPRSVKVSGPPAVVTFS